MDPLQIPRRVAVALEAEQQNKCYGPAALMAGVVLGMQVLLTALDLASSETSLWRLVASVVVGAAAYGVGLMLFGGIAPIRRVLTLVRGGGPAVAQPTSV